MSAVLGQPALIGLPELWFYLKVGHRPVALGRFSMFENIPLISRRIAVMGLGSSGMSAAQTLHASGAEVWLWDDDPQRRQQASAQGFILKNLASCSLEGIKELVLSPGIAHCYPSPHPAVINAKRWPDIAVIGDIELLARACPQACYLGVSGSNGKSTTTALIGHIMAARGLVRVAVGGNLGVPALELQPLSAGEWYVLEVSSYQLELSRSVPFRIAVLLNISPDHLERHGGLEGYIKAKQRLFMQSALPADPAEPRVAIVGVDDAHSQEVYHWLKREGHWQVIPISGYPISNGPSAGRPSSDWQQVRGEIGVQDGWLYDMRSNQSIIDLKSLRAPMNWQNVAAAYAATQVAGFTSEQIIAGLQTFSGLEHRQQLVALIDGVDFVNDSKATNPAATAQALAECGPNIYWIAGGRAKQGGWELLEPAIGAVRQAFLIGEAAEDLADWLDQCQPGEAKGELPRRNLSGPRKCIPYTVCLKLEEAICQAAELAWSERRERPCVLLSPACASFDQFANFEVRGQVFIQQVQHLQRSHRKDGHG